MPDLDLDIEAALREREDALKSMQEKHWAAKGQEWTERSILTLRQSQVHVWEPKALEALDEYWSRPGARKRFVQLCFNGRQLRHMPALIGTEFHFCPADGWYFNQAMVPNESAEPWTEAIFRPTTRVIGITTTTEAGIKYLPTLLGTTHLFPRKVGIENWTKIEQEIARMPRRNLMRSTIVQFTAESRFPIIRDGMVFSPMPLDWLEKLYQMRLFLEQPWVGATRIRPPKKNAKDPSRFSRETMDVVKVHMRDGLPARIPRFVLPTVGRFTGRPLEFEVDVKSYLRHCASGLIVKVRAHSRGPKGQKRERVIKVVR